ncbi:MAG: GNAT family N-acetyltransferase [Rhodobacteraceae bacterium]|jgi:putative acetyltransferase|nr:GNAT family N-acetyltransferase [Paracoccaceae bacterium]
MAMRRPIRLRRFRAGDAPACHALCRRAVHIGAAAAYTPEERAAWVPPGPMPEGWPDRFRGQLAWVAQAGRRLAGFIAAGRDGHIDLLYTDPDFTRQGIARRLYARAEAELAGLGLSLLTTEASLVAQPFFAAQGWQTEARQSVIRRGVALTNFRMAKRLGGCPVTPGR